MKLVADPGSDEFSPPITGPIADNGSHRGIRSISLTRPSSALYLLGLSMWVVVVSFRPGLTFGSTDDYGFRAAENPVHVQDLHATILHQLGFDHERLTLRHAGRDFRITDVGGRVLREIVS
jgi:hypothetical protein